MAKGCAYDELYARLETKEGKKELYRLARQRDRAGKDLQHVRVIKDENGNVMVNLEAVLTLKAPLTRIATMRQNCKQSEICFFSTN